MPSANDPTAMDLLVQLAQETRADVKHIREDVGDLALRVTRLEVQVAAGGPPSPANGAVGALLRSLPAKATAGTGAALGVVYAIVVLLQTLGVLPPSAIATPTPAPPAVTAAP